MHVGKASLFSPHDCFDKVDFCDNIAGRIQSQGPHSAKYLEYLEASYCFGQSGSAFSDNHASARVRSVADESKHL